MCVCVCARARARVCAHKGLGCRGRDALYVRDHRTRSLGAWSSGHPRRLNVVHVCDESIGCLRIPDCTVQKREVKKIIRTVNRYNVYAYEQWLVQQLVRCQNAAGSNVEHGQCLPPLGTSWICRHVRVTISGWIMSRVCLQLNQHRIPLSL